jgi:hypothetical protein
MVTSAVYSCLLSCHILLINELHVQLRSLNANIAGVYPITIRYAHEYMTGD